MTMPGLETVAFSEIKTRLRDAALVKFGRGIALFTSAAAPHLLRELRTTEDVYVALAHITGLGRSVDALRVLHSATKHADITTALASWGAPVTTRPHARGASSASKMAPMPFAALMPARR